MQFRLCPFVQRPVREGSIEQVVIERDFLGVARDIHCPVFEPVFPGITLGEGYHVWADFHSLEWGSCCLFQPFR